MLLNSQNIDNNGNNMYTLDSLAQKAYNEYVRTYLSQNTNADNMVNLYTNAVTQMTKAITLTDCIN